MPTNSGRNGADSTVCIAENDRGGRDSVRCGVEPAGFRRKVICRVDVRANVDTLVVAWGT